MKTTKRFFLVFLAFIAIVVFLQPCHGKDKKAPKAPTGLTIVSNPYCQQPDAQQWVTFIDFTKEDGKEGFRVTEKNIAKASNMEKERAKEFAETVMKIIRAKEKQERTRIVGEEALHFGVKENLCSKVFMVEFQPAVIRQTVEVREDQEAQGQAQQFYEPSKKRKILSTVLAGAPMALSFTGYGAATYPAMLGASLVSNLIGSGRGKHATQQDKAGEARKTTNKTFQMKGEWWNEW